MPLLSPTVMGKGAALKDDNWEGFKKALVPGATLMMMGTPSKDIEAVTSTSTVNFVEDLPPESQLLAAENLAPGLKNLGNTCYMNASLQMLNAMPELEQALEPYNAGEARDSGGKVTFAMKDVIRQLRHAKGAVTPLVFLMNLRQYYPRFAEQQNGHYAQQSADECWVQLVQAFKVLPKLDKGPMAFGNSGIEQLLQGEMVKSTRCVGTEEEPAIEIESFETLLCPVVPVKFDGPKISFLFQGIQQSLNSEIVKRNPATNADAAYAVTERISRLPYYLVVQFLRFEWKKGEGSRAKILRPVEFPFDFDAYEFCSDDLKKGLNDKREEVRKRNDVPAAERKAVEQGELKNETAYYELAAVLTHQGRDADGGHYVSWVRQEGDNWICFDDDKVSSVGTDDIKKLVGHGGADWHQAYMCLYRTKQFK